jgi:hypothetical protein
MFGFAEKDRQWYTSPRIVAQMLDDARFAPLAAYLLVWSFSGRSWRFGFFWVLKMKLGAERIVKRLLSVDATYLAGSGNMRRGCAG